MQSSGFTSTPTTLLTLLFLTSTTLLVSITTLKHHLPLQPTPHLYPYLQLHRLLTHQVAYTNSADLLFGSALLYRLRVLERLWGTRKFASFVLVAALCNAVLTPLVLVAVVRPLSGGGGARWNYLPAGPVGVVFAAVAVWAEEVPCLWRYEVGVWGGGSSTAGSAAEEEEEGSSGRRRGRRKNQRESSSTTLTLSDKSTTYLLACQLALTQFPYTLLPAVVGYFIGLAWAGDLLPGGMSRWRVPSWAVGEGSMFVKQGSNAGSSGVERERYEGLRRRLEEEGGRGGDGDGMRQAAHARAGGIGSQGEGDGERERQGGAARRRPMGVQIADYFRGVF